MPCTCLADPFPLPHLCLTSLPLFIVRHALAAAFSPPSPLVPTHPGFILTCDIPLLPVPATPSVVIPYFTFCAAFLFFCMGSCLPVPALWDHACRDPDSALDHYLTCLTYPQLLPLFFLVFMCCVHYYLLWPGGGKVTFPSRDLACWTTLAPPLCRSHACYYLPACYAYMPATMPKVLPTSAPFPYLHSCVLFSSQGHCLPNIWTLGHLLPAAPMLPYMPSIGSGCCVSACPYYLPSDPTLQFIYCGFSLGLPPCCALLCCISPWF